MLEHIVKSIPRVGAKTHDYYYYQHHHVVVGCAAQKMT